MSAKKKTISRVLSLVLIVALIVPALLAVPVLADTAVVKSGSCGTSVNYILYDDGTIVINGVGAMKDYTNKTADSTKAPWYSYGNDITTVIIGEGVTHVGDKAFDTTASSRYPNITSVSLPSSLLSIGEGAFTDCTNLPSIEIPASVVTIDYMAFYGCQKIKGEVVLPTGLVALGHSAFYTLDKVVFQTSSPPAGVGVSASGQFFSSSEYIDIVVPYGSLNEYMACEELSNVVGYIREAEKPIVYPSVAEDPQFTAETGGSYYYLQGVQADPIVVSAVVGDGGEISYKWYEDFDTTFTVVSSSSTFVPPTNEVGTRNYHCEVTNKVYNPNVEGNYLYSTSSTFTYIVSVVSNGGGGSSGDTPTTPTVPTSPDYSEKFDDLQNSMDEMPDKITDGMQDIMEQEKEQANQQGGQFVDDITGVVPNDSQGFIDALGSLVSVLSYDGTECVLPIPALTLPAIGGLFPSYTVMEAQEVDFEEFFAMMPPAIMLLVQSLLTVALIVYCFKELYDTVAYFFVLKGGNK